MTFSGKAALGPSHSGHPRHGELDRIASLIRAGDLTFSDPFPYRGAAAKDGERSEMAAAASGPTAPSPAPATTPGQ
jgi:hypothetical protein